MGKIKISKGGNVLKDIGKNLAPVAKELLPVAKEIGTALLKKKMGLGVREIPVHLGKHHITKLKKGGAININPKMIKEGASHMVHMLPDKAQQLVEAITSSSPYKYAMSRGERLMRKGGDIEINYDDDSDSDEDSTSGVSNPRTSQMEGGKLNFGKVLSDVGKHLKPVAKELAPVAKELAVALIKKKAGLGVKRRGGKLNFGKVLSDVGRNLKPVAEVAAPIAKDIAVAMIKKKAGLGTHQPSPEDIGAPYHHRHHGMGLYPAGGGLYPAGLRGGAIQLGSPYIGVYSPAFNPYFSNHNPFKQDSPITGGKIRGSDVLHGVAQGIQTIAPLIPLMML
jgi:hypothetical protein